DELEESSLPVDQPILDRKYIAAVKQAQKNAELENFSTRSSMLAWDKAIRSQRLIFYHMRNEIVDIASCKEIVTEYITQVVSQLVQRHFPAETSDEPPEWIRLFAELSVIFPSTQGVELKGIDELSRRKAISQIRDQ